jgi:hypothetical protein
MGFNIKVGAKHPLINLSAIQVLEKQILRPYKE